MDRRDFILTAGGAAAFAELGKVPGAARQGSPEPLKVIVFSKHLQFLGWEELAQTAAGIGFDGIDLTVRNGGHVLPERVKEDLPKAAEIITRAGLVLPMVTTGIVDSESPYADAIIGTLGNLGIRRYRWGGLHYVDSAPIPDQLERLKIRVARLGELNRKHGVCAMYHTHSGNDVGAPIWDLWVLLKDLGHEWLGINYDVCHATIEGGLGGWIRSLQLTAPWLKGVAVKDFKWDRNEKGRWQPQYCPLGEGMVDFDRFFALLKKTGFSGPVQVHYEYPLGGADKGNRTLTIDKSQVIEAMQRDLTTLRGWLARAQLA